MGVGDEETSFPFELDNGFDAWEFSLKNGVQLFKNKMISYQFDEFSR
jgi:hypothetical protein